MSRSRFFLLVATAATISSFTASHLSAQGARMTTGPVIMSGGAAFDVPNVSFPTPPSTHEYKIVYVVNRGTPDSATTGTNEQLNTVARFLNLHVRNGVPRERIHLAAVVHGTGFKDLLTDEEHMKRYGVKNPSGTFVRELLGAGVQLILCGQTASARAITQEQLLPGAKIALSAMTALNALYAQGYQLNPW
ncbi:MAG: DsrE family protein [Ilumatobacteraceae bacterium]